MVACVHGVHMDAKGQLFESLPCFRVVEAGSLMFLIEFTLVYSS